MKQHWFSNILGAVALTLGAAWTQMGTAVAVPFSPPVGTSAPRSATGGASRSSFFTPPVGTSAPRSATGGASRGDFFWPSVNSSAPREATGGASRGDFFPTVDDALPQGSAGGASRGLFEGGDDAVATTGGTARSNVYGEVTATTAPSLFASMLAVVPESFYGTTLEARPTIMVYVPASEADTALFSLKNEAKEMVYQTTIAVPATGGIVVVEMPEEAPALAMSEHYQWYVALPLEGKLIPGSPFVDGWIKRIEPSADMALALAQGDALSKVETLGANGVWYDTAAQLASLQSAPADAAMAGHWHELLESVGLEEIAAVPIVM